MEKQDKQLTSDVASTSSSISDISEENVLCPTTSLPSALVNVNRATVFDTFFRGDISYKEIVKVTYPLILMNASSSIMNFIDRKFLSMDSSNSVSAALPAGVLFFTLGTFFLLTIEFSTSIISQYYGKKDIKGGCRATWVAVTLALIAGVITATVIPPIGHHILGSSNHSAELITLEQSYFDYLMPFTIFLFLSAAFSSFFSGIGKTWHVAIIQIVACVANLILDYMLIFGHFGAPKLGIVGAALATSLSFVIGALFAFILFIAQDQTKYPTRHLYFEHINLFLGDLKRILKFGMPTGVQIFLSVSAFSYIIFLLGELGPLEMFLATVALSINFIVFLPLLGLSQGVGIIVGQKIGAEDLHTAHVATHKGLLLSFVYTIVMLILFTFFSDHLFLFFHSPNISEEAFEKSLKLGKLLLIVLGIQNLFSAVRFTFMGALRGAGDTRVPMLIVVLTSWLYLAPGGYIVVKLLHCHVLTLWIFVAGYPLILGVALWTRFKLGHWKQVEMLDS